MNKFSHGYFMTQVLIIDPNDYIKSAAFKTCQSMCESFLTQNGFELPNILTEANDLLKPPGKNPWHDKGWYWNSTIYVNVKSSRFPVKNPGFSWSYTGFKADLTAPGVLAHETGHYVKDMIEDSHIIRTVLNNELKAISMIESNVSSYEPNVEEMWAEAFRLFIINPDLLRIGRPKRYEMFTKLKLAPIHNLPWQEVLANAHPKILKATESWIKRNV